MAKTRRSRRTSKTRNAWAWLFVILGLAVAAVLFAWRAPIAGYAGAGTAYSARVVCSCRFVGGREMADCAKDKIAGTELVMLSADEDEKSVTATIPLVASETATYREGYGCVLQPWRG